MEANGSISHEEKTVGKDVAIGLMRVVRGVLKPRLATGTFVSPVPKTLPGGYLMVLVSPLMNRRGEVVGEMRVNVYVPSDPVLDILIRVEWTRNAFGFWYRKDIRMSGESGHVSVQPKIREIMRWIATTADGTVSVTSMNRMFRKIRKNPSRDRAARMGMVMG